MTVENSLRINPPSFNFQLPQAQQTFKLTTPKLEMPTFSLTDNWQNRFSNMLDRKLNMPKTNKGLNLGKVGNQVASSGISALSSNLSGTLSNEIFGDDTELGRSLGTIFSQGISSSADTLSNNILKGTSLSEGLLQNAGASIAGAGAGIAANYIGQGINSLGGNSMLSRGIGQGVATGLGTIGGTAASNLVKTGSTGTLFGKGAGAINPYGLAATVIGTGLGAALGPSKEYGGKYGNTTRTLDTAYDVVSTAVNVIPGWGQLASGLMTLNKGLSNVFGSTDGMTRQDAILGSAFMPAPVKWLNMAGAQTTSKFKNQSWQNNMKASNFMQNSFGNLNDKFDKAREESGKTYGTFSQGAYRNAQNNLNFANRAWEQVLAMADQNELQNIRSQYMSSINNQRYAQSIQGAWQPLYRGKQGMKILNNATNHNIGQRLLSGAALIDNKQMILCSVVD